MNIFNRIFILFLFTTIVYAIIKKRILRSALRELRMKKRDFYYELPKELIAQDPLDDRSGSRLMVLGRSGGNILHRNFKDILGFLNDGDCLVVNDTKVIPARLYGINGTGSAIEVLLLKRLQGDTWEALVKPGKRARMGTWISFDGEVLAGEVTGITDGGNRLVRFTYDGIFEEILDRLGRMPLPPYITHELRDKDRYQTVYARWEGSVAAPTAGLHFTEELLEDVARKGVKIAHVTLHVGLGTFRPVKEDDILDHRMHPESYVVTAEEADKINQTKRNGGRVICVGTTSCRTVESISDEGGFVHAGGGDTNMFIYPGYRFKVMDGLVTNFHLPESTLLMLVSAFAGRERVLEAYGEAAREGYRFFSFGDAMLIL